MTPRELDALSSLIERAALAEADRQEALRLLQRLGEKLTAAEHAKSAFLATTSHELRTPMNAIIGYSDILVGEVEEHGLIDAAEDLRRINAAGKHLLVLIDDILELSTILAGRSVLQVETFDLEALVAELRSAVEPLAAAGGNTLEVAVAPGVGTACADRHKVMQILRNLLSNACKFTEGGTVSLTAERAEGDVVVFRVSDTGIGMDPDQIGRLYQPFTQSDASSTRRHGGTGIGLAVTRRYVEMMRGGIEVESAPGTGTRFTVRLPVHGRDSSSEGRPDPAGLPD